MRTPLYDAHVRAGAKLVDFNGWDMPLWYAGIVEEHRRVRTKAGLFDISHMGRLDAEGPEALDVLQRIFPFDVAALAPGRIKYSFLLNDRGGIVDDLLVYRHEGRLSIVANAGNREKVVAGLRSLGAGRRWTLTDRTRETAMVAVQGPAALGIAERLVGEPLGAVKYYGFIEHRLPFGPAVVSRTGYTGEDGVELIVPAASADRLWEALLDLGRPAGLAPAGLGARDTLRLEAAMPLHGHEISESITPLEAGLDRAFQIEKAGYPGREALLAQRASGVPRIRTGLRVTEGKRVPRAACAVTAGDREVGVVTSGTFSPTLEAPIALALVAPAHAATGTTLGIRIRDRSATARVVPLPFYRRPSVPADGGAAAFPK
jgi:aminomethyltransferase